MDYALDLGGVPPEVYEHLQKVASPAHLAQYVTKDMPPDAQWRPSRHLKVINRELVQAVTDVEQTFLNVAASFRHGKEQSNRTPILTLDGWKNAVDIEPGDEVFGPDGKPLKVTAVTPVNLLSPKMRVTTTAGGVVDVHPNHEWTVMANGHTKRRVLETREMARDLRLPSGALRYKLPARSPVEFPEADLPIPPYLLGVWLGDGVASQPTLTLAPQDAAEILQAVADTGWRTSWRKSHARTGVIHAGFRGLIQILRALDLRANKHIPALYEHASIDQRHALLQGLVDTDGCQDPDGRIRYVGRDERLVRGVQRVACSLGYKATVKSQVDTREPHEIDRLEVKTAGTMWCCSWFPHDGRPPGRVARKAKVHERRQRGVSIASIEPIEPASGVCIQVDSEDGLYLVGHELTPTHNSEIISRFLPVWFLGHFPDRQVILVSYNEDKAAEWGEFARNIMEEFGPELFDLTVDKSSKAKTYWKIKGHRGAMRSVGVGGSLTGLGGDLIIIDDPIKNREEADSPAARESMWLWYGSTLRTRLMNPGGTLILTMARWHEDDLTGKIQQHASGFSDPWRTVTMPAIAEAPKGADLDTWTDIIGRKEGEPLWPEKWPLPALLQLRDSIGAVNWNSLAQQNPTPPEGKLFKVKNWRYVPEAPGALRMVRFWDTASTKSKTADWTVGVKMGFSPTNEVYVLDVVRFREGPGETEKRIVETAKLDGITVPIRMEVGKAGEGKVVAHNYKRTLIGYDFDGIKPEGDKETRANPFAIQQGNHNVHLVGSEDRQMWKDYVEEHRVFPGGRHDDQVDASSGAFTYLAEGGAFEMEFASAEVEQAMQAMMSRGFSFSR